MTSPFEETFDDQVRKLRTGDTDAVRAFVDTYEPFLRRSIRRRLARTSLQAAADSADVCQSALGSFLIRMAAGQFEFADRTSLENLLLTITRRKLAALARYEYAECRDRSRATAWNAGADRQAAETRQQQGVDFQDLIESVKRRMPSSERELFDLRQQGMSWQQIADHITLPPTVLRKRLSRALRLAAEGVGVDLADQ